MCALNMNTHFWDAFTWFWDMSYASAFGCMLKVMWACKLAFYSSYNINKLQLFLCLAVRYIGKFLLWNHDEYELMWCGQNLTVYIEIVSRMLKKNYDHLTVCPTNIT